MKYSHLPQEVQTLLKTISRLAKKRKIKLYLVGGILRDMVLKREKANPDIDFCLKNKAISFAKVVSQKLKAGFVVLDKEHGCARVVKEIDDKIYTLDFTDFRGKTQEEDLFHRDFTVNILSIELEKIFTAGDLKDVFIAPFGAMNDLKSRVIRTVNKKGFDEDPLRILRAFSMAAMFDLKIDKETLRLMKLKKEKLAEVSGERIRDELFKTFDTPHAYNYLGQMDKLKILKLIIPEIEMMRKLKQGPYHHLDVWQHTQETIRQLENLIQELKKNKDIQDYLNTVISSDRRRRALIKLGALLHDIGKPKAMRRENGKIKFHGHERIGLEISENIIKRLRLSNDELDSLKKMISCHLRPGYLADNEKITLRATFRYFRDAGCESVSTLLISLADQRATKGPLTTSASRIRHEKVVLDLIKEYFKRKKEKKLPRLINGNILMREFKLEPSSLIGKILREIEELQAIGKIKTKKEALKTAQKFIPTLQSRPACFALRNKTCGANRIGRDKK